MAHQHNLQQSDPSLYQFAVDEAPGMVLAMAFTAGKVDCHDQQL